MYRIRWTRVLALSAALGALVLLLRMFSAEDLARIPGCARLSRLLYGARPKEGARG